MGRFRSFARRGWMDLRILLTDARQIPAAVIRARKNGKAPYILYGAHYNEKSAGCVACHRLVHDLNESGFDAFSRHPTNPSWNERRLSNFGAALLTRYGNAIVIYPEIVSGNPLRAGRVARWVLFFPGQLGGDEQYSPDELVFTWSQKYYNTDRVLSLDLVDRELFNDRDLPPKELDCFYHGKGSLSSSEKASFSKGLTEITFKWPASRPELANLLRRTRVLYTNDGHTALVREARLCGCQIILVPECREIPMDISDQFDQQTYQEQFARFAKETQSLPVN